MTDEKIEETLMNLSNMMSAMAKDIESIKKTIDSNQNRSNENDDAVKQLLEERTKYACNRQDTIKSELQCQINLLKKSEELQSKQNEYYMKQIKDMNDRITAIENARKNRVFSRWEQVADKAFWIVLAIIFAAIFKYFNFVPPKPF